MCRSTLVTEPSRKLTISAARACARKRSSQRVDRPLARRSARGDEDWSRDPDDQERDGEPDETAGDDVGRIVGADQDAAGGDEDRRSEEEAADDTVEEEDGEGDSERCARVVARERRAVGAASPDVRARVGCEWALPVPDRSDQLIHE